MTIRYFDATHPQQTRLDFLRRVWGFNLIRQASPASPRRHGIPQAASSRSIGLAITWAVRPQILTRIRRITTCPIAGSSSIWCIDPCYQFWSLLDLFAALGAVLLTAVSALLTGLPGRGPDDEPSLYLHVCYAATRKLLARCSAEQLQ
ncbi:hypothetical protein E4U58_005860 [Claviceps cyperi]|nr:hypothetical protein E4U58_005860 [Claviceps cyperi]